MLVNGSRATTLPLDNRGLTYGDGLFETIRIHRGNLLFIEQHLHRLASGLEILGIEHCTDKVRGDIASLKYDLPDDGILKIMITRGAGGRGYRPAANAGADRILTVHALPALIESSDAIKAFVCATRLQPTPLAGIKHLNRLEQVMASREWPGREYHEGLMLGSNDQVIEGTRSNVFLVSKGRLMTPDLSQAGIEGILREELIGRFPETQVTDISLTMLEQADEVFFCNSVAGVWPVREIRTSSGQLTEFQPGEWCSKAMEFFHTSLEELE